jgi:hypothetical protein
LPPNSCLFKDRLGLVNGFEAPGDAALAVANSKNAFAFDTKAGDLFAVKSAAVAFRFAQEFEICCGLDHALVPHGPRQEWKKSEKEEAKSAFHALNGKSDGRLSA